MWSFWVIALLQTLWLANSAQAEKRAEDIEIKPLEKASVTQAQEIPYDFPQTLLNRQTMVHLFEWKWTDIAKECEDFLQYYGYGAVQISPPQEHIIVHTSLTNIPWWIRYQPVSYKLVSRDGTREELIDMINRCNKVGVRIVADVVLNHMTGVNQKYGVNGVNSSDGTYFDATEGIESFPGVPYCTQYTNDFRCDHNIEPSDYMNNATAVRNCRLVGLIDLNQADECVRMRMVTYLNELISLGVAGFRFDASKHMWPSDLKAIIYRLDNLNEKIFGPNQRPFAVHEVIDYGGEAVKAIDYIDKHIGRYTDFDYGYYMNLRVRKLAENKGIEDLQWFGKGYGYGAFNSSDILAFIDNHDDQRDNPLKVLTYKDGDLYALAVGFMLAFDYGYPRVMSSYYFDNKDQGPPHSPKDPYEITSPVFDSQYKTCDKNSGWVCEHRWRAIRNMVKFRSVVGDAPLKTVSTHSQGSNHIAIAREGKGYFAANANSWAWTQNDWIQTTLPGGNYCDIFNDDFVDGKCSGNPVNVNSKGFTPVNIRGSGCMALHIEAKIN